MGQKEAQHSILPGVAEEVRDFYERYPYPRPIDSLEKYQRLGGMTKWCSMHPSNQGRKKSVVNLLRTTGQRARIESGNQESKG